MPTPNKPTYITIPNAPVKRSRKDSKTLNKGAEHAPSSAAAEDASSFTTPPRPAKKRKCPPLKQGAPEEKSRGYFHLRSNLSAIVDGGNAMAGGQGLTTTPPLSPNVTSTPNTTTSHASASSDSDGGDVDTFVFHTP